MENICKLYNGKNNDILEIISWINFAIGFDKSIMKFANPDLFSLLENINSYDFANFDDLECILICLDDAFVHIQNNIHKNILRKHEIVHISQANEFDEKSIDWIARQNGISIRDKLSKNQILAVRSKSSADTYENRVLKSVILMLRPLFNNPYFAKYDPLFKKMLRFLRDELAEVNHLGGIIENNILLYHKDYSKFYKASKWLARLRVKVADFDKFRQEILDKKGEICKFIALANLHKFTKTHIKPSLLLTKQDDYEIKFDDDFLISSDISNFTNFSDNVNLKDIAQKNLDLIKSKIQIVNPPFYSLQSQADEMIFADIFRLYPLICAADQTVKMPLLLRQKIDDVENVNANHSKIIIADTKFDTMYNVLLNEKEKLSIFLRDIKKAIGESENLYYVLPDFVNMFDFNETHKTIRSYFPKANFLQKSIVMASKFIFEKSVMPGTTLLFIQENEKGQAFATPILVGYDERQKDGITGGLVLEKYPTKQVDSMKIKNKKIQSKIQEKFGIISTNELRENDIKFYINSNLYPITSIENIEKKRISQFLIKQKYTKFNKLFKASIIEIYDENSKDFLVDFQTLIMEKLKGNILYTEHLPNLEIVVENDFEEINFSLVDENSELNYKNEILIKNHFQIPAGVTDVKAPLILDDGKIAFYMLLNSKQMPFDEPVECELRLEYNYEAENIYTLFFTPLNANYQCLIAKWVSGELKRERKDMSKIYPSFVPQATINELKNYPRKDGDGTNDLFEWVQNTLKRIMHSNRINGEVYAIIDNYCFVRDDESDEILCHKDRFINEVDWYNLKNGDMLYFTKHKSKDGKYRANNISYEKVYMGEKFINYIKDNIKTLRFPMLKIFDGHTLQESEISNSFRETIVGFNIFIKEILKNSTITNKLKEELILFFSCLHENSGIGSILLNECDNILAKYPQALSYSIGSCTQEWQKELFNKAIINCQKRVLSVCLWRDKNLVFQIDEKTAKLLIEQTYEDMRPKNLNRVIEIYLALLRLRSIGYDILNPDDEVTKNILSKLNNDSFKNNKLRSYLQLEVKKPSEYNDIDDLIYALLSFIKGQNTNSIKIIGTNDES